MQARELGDVLTEVQGVVTSTNDVVPRPSDGWALLTADEQASGRGRAGRQWSSPWAAGVAMSLWAPLAHVRCTLTALPLVVGLAVSDVLAGVPSRLKWPNDLLVAGRKVGGILVNLHPTGVVMGIGLNTHLRPEELPTHQATSLMLEGADVSRETLIADIAAAVRLRVAGSGDWRGEYLARCATVGQLVRVDLVGGDQVLGRCDGVTPDGALVVDAADGTHVITVGDVHHLRAET